MKKNMKKVSAFKLFYDEFVYRENSNISYALIERNIEKIRELTLELRKTSKVDVDFYMVKLDRANSRIKEQLNEMYKANVALFEYFFLLYKSCMEMCNDKVLDMPFLISCAFYEDYRLDNKTAEELESSPYVVPKFTSLEKKEIRNDAKGMTKLEYFVKKLSNSENVSQYTKFIDKARAIMNTKPTINESHNDYFARGENFLKDFDVICSRLEEKAKLNGDYEIVSDYMEVVFRKKFNDWSVELKKVALEYLDKNYKKMKESNEIKGCFNLANDISFESFKDLTEDLIQEKEKYMKLFENGKFSPVEIMDDTYISKFKENLINSFFDKRYINSLNDDSSVMEYVDRTIDIYNLAEDLGNQIFERIMFDASHSPSLKRNNDVRSAIITKIYDLYNPIYLLALFEKAKNGFESLLANNSSKFIKDYNAKLTEKKLQYDFHGPLPTMKSIKTKILDRRKEFIVEHCITELKSRDLLESYDTRNYDLEIVAKDIEINEMITLYDQIKYKVNTFDYSSLYFYNKEIALDGYEKQETLKAAQEFVVKDICSKLKINNLSANEMKERYRDICYGYFNEECLFVSDKEEIEVNDNLEFFYKVRDKFIQSSKWNEFLTNNKIKSSLQ